MRTFSSSAGLCILLGMGAYAAAWQPSPGHTQMPIWPSAVSYDFSPLHMASYLSGVSGLVSDEDVRLIEQQLNTLAEEAERLVPDERGHICSIAGMNQYFTQHSLDELIVRVRNGVRLVPRVIHAVREIEEESAHSRIVREKGPGS
jgi:hypothetical protein